MFGNVVFLHGERGGSGWEEGGVIEEEAEGVGATGDHHEGNGSDGAEVGNFAEAHRHGRYSLEQEEKC